MIQVNQLGRSDKAVSIWEPLKIYTNDDEVWTLFIHMDIISHTAEINVAVSDCAASDDSGTDFRILLEPMATALGAMKGKVY